MKMKTTFVGAGILVSGIAFACKTLPFPVPPVPVTISAADVAKAVAAGGTSNALHRAAMTKLDSLGSAAVGASTWTANNFVGYFSYRTSIGGINMVFIDKPCGKKAAQAFSSGVASGGGGGGGGGGGAGGTGGTMIGSGCYGNCGGKVTVGELENA